jgi:hypothetical protein
MQRVLHCLGTQHPRGSIEYFFVILTVIQEELKHQTLSSTEIMRLAEGHIQSLTTVAENEKFSAFVDKLLPMIEHQYGKPEAIAFLENFMELVARSTTGSTFNAANFLKQHMNDPVFKKLYTAISLYNQGSAATLLGNLAIGAFALSRQESFPAWDGPTKPIVQSHDPAAQAAA